MPLARSMGESGEELAGVSGPRPQGAETGGVPFRPPSPAGVGLGMRSWNKRNPHNHSMMSLVSDGTASPAHIPYPLTHTHPVRRP